MAFREVTEAEFDPVAPTTSGGWQEVTPDMFDPAPASIYGANNAQTFGRAMAGGLSQLIPWGDEIVGGGAALADYAKSGDYLRNPFSTYDARNQEIQDYQKAFNDRAGGWATATQVGSGLLLPGISKIDKAKGAWETAKTLAKEGAAWGGLYGAGEGEGWDRLKNLAKGAAIGGGSAPLFGGAIYGLSKLAQIPSAVGRMFRDPEIRAGEKLIPYANDINALPATSENPLYQYQTLAEATQNPAIAQLEQDIGKSSTVANTLLAENRAARRSAHSDMLGDLSTQKPTTPETGGNLLRQQLQVGANEARDAASNLYKSIDQGGEIPLGPVAQALNEKLGTIYEAGGAPGALRSMSEDLSRVQAPKPQPQSGLLDQFGKPISTPEAGEATKGFSYLHSLRQRAGDAWEFLKNNNNTRGSSTAQELINAIDDAIEQGSKNGGISPETYAKFVEAKKAFSDFSTTYQGQNGVGRALQNSGAGRYNYTDSSVPGLVFDGTAEGTRKLVTALPKTPESLDIARGVVRDKIVRDSSNADGILRPSKFRETIRKVKDALSAESEDGRRLFDDEHITSLEQISDDLAFLDPNSVRSVNKLAHQASLGQPTTAQALTRLGQKSVMSRIPGYRLIEKAAEGFTMRAETAANDILGRAFVDKDFAKIVTEKATADSVTRAIAYLRNAQRADSAAMGTSKFLGSAAGQALEGDSSSQPADSSPNAQGFQPPATSAPKVGPQASQSPMLDSRASDQLSTSGLPQAKGQVLGKQEAGQPSRPLFTSKSPQAKLPAPQLDQIVNTVVTDERLRPIVHAMIQAESSGKPNAVSKVNAQGLMQLMPAMQKALGVKDAFDPVQNVTGGYKLIQEELGRFGDLALALAAYNAGSPKVKAAIKKAGSSDFADVREYLPEETRNYVDKISKALMA